MSSAFLNNLLVFGRLLRTLGISVPLGRLFDAAEALHHIDIGSRHDVYHTCRSLLVHRHDQLASFDRAFDAFWRSLQSESGRHTPQPQPGAARREGGVRDEHGEKELIGQLVALEQSGADADGARGIGMWSDTGGIANKDFAAFTTEELRVAHATLERLVWMPDTRRTRRWIAGGGSRVDLRRALARSRRTAGEIVTLPRRTRRVRPRPLVLICDVSRSMERYSRMLLHFAHAMSRRHQQLEAFVFSTTLTRVTMPLRTRRVDEALAGVAHAVPDWSGGTRIGEALKRFHQQWARRVVHHGPVVLLMSDGWDRGDPLELRDQVARLQRNCHRLIWLNPLIGTADYAPLTRGLQAALPYVDDFLPVRTMTDMADLAVHLNTLAAAGHRSGV